MITQKPSSLLACLITERKRLVRYLTGRTGCATTAEDILQEAWLKLDRNDYAEQVSNPLAYLQRMTCNLAIDNARADSRRRLEPMEVEALLAYADESPNAEQQVCDAQQLECLAMIVEELPPRCREIFLAARVEGTSHKQLAQRFGVSVRTVELDVRRALDHCSQRLRQLAGEG